MKAFNLGKDQIEHDDLTAEALSQWTAQDRSTSSGSCVRAVLPNSARPVPSMVSFQKSNS